MTTTTMTRPHPVSRKGKKVTQQEINEAFQAKFTSHFGGALVVAANEHNWNGNDRVHAHAMAKSLLEGDESTPRADDGDNVAQLVQSMFVAYCVEHKVRPGSIIPGTNTEWFALLREEEQERHNAKMARERKQATKDA